MQLALWESRRRLLGGGRTLAVGWEGGQRQTWVDSELVRLGTAYRWMVAAPSAMQDISCHVPVPTKALSLPVPSQSHHPL